MNHLLIKPPAARFALALAHGAGAGMRHPFMETVSQALAGVGVATYRYEFPYMEAGEKRPDPPARAEARVREAVAAAATALPGLPLFVGGKSFGGRMSSGAQSRAPLPGVRGLVFFGFPLHAAGRPDDSRAAHLASITVPMLFLQGTRDTLADLDLIRGVCEHLGPLATLHVVAGADHSFSVLKRSGRTSAEVLTELASTTAAWMARHA